MKDSTRIILFAGLAVLVLDTIGSFSSMQLGFPYACLAPISFLIYAMAGFFVARSASVWTSLFAGIIVGFVDATIGWAISWIIGPGKMPGVEFTTGMFIITAFSVVAIGAICALVGGVIGMLFRKSKIGVPKSKDSPGH